MHRIYKYNISTYRFWPVCRSSYYSFNYWRYFERFKAHFTLRIITTAEFLPTAIKLRHVVLTADISRAQDCKWKEPRLPQASESLIVRGRRVGNCPWVFCVHIKLIYTIIYKELLSVIFKSGHPTDKIKKFPISVTHRSGISSPVNNKGIQF